MRKPKNEITFCSFDGVREIYDGRVRLASIRLNAGEFEVRDNDDTLIGGFDNYDAAMMAVFLYQGRCAEGGGQ